MLVLLLRTVARRGFFRRQRGGVFRERWRATTTAHGHRTEHHSHREPLPSQWRFGCACAEQAGPTWRPGSPTALRQLLSAHGRSRYVISLCQQERSVSWQRPLASCEERERKPTRCNNQMFIINTVSTCFGHHYAHLQENKDRVLLHVVYCAGCGW